MTKSGDSTGSRERETAGRWKPGDRLTHRFNAELGPGVVVSVEGRQLVVQFPASGTTLRLADDPDALAPFEVRAGTRARSASAGGVVVVEEVLGDGRCLLAGGRAVRADDLWPLEALQSPLERLAEGRIDPIEDFANRLDALHLASIREADGLGSFLGGRIRIFPHQLHVAERATRSDPVRWLLADEVGLGKTVESCLILNRLLRTGRADSTLVVAPETLTIQWLGELWRKYHQVFVLLDRKRLADVARDFGEGFNPFETHRRAVLGLETLLENPRLTDQAIEAGIDLLIVDEAHHLRRPPGHPGNPAYRALAPIAAAGRHVLLLTATPLEDDAHGFFRLLQLLRPEEFPEDAAIEERIAELGEEGRPLPPCVSSTRRADIGGLPPRIHAPVEIAEDEAWTPLLRLETAVRARPASNAAQRRAKAARILRALSSGAALEAVLSSGETKLRDLARAAQESDPRVRWLTGNARTWKESSEKTLVFVAGRETLEAVRQEMERSSGVLVGVFHEDLSPAQRDIEVARFRLPSGPTVLISTECGGEGRNFEFCTRLVLFDQPWSPGVVEQRIGRLDRIGRKIPVEIVTFTPPGGLGAAIDRLYRSIGLYREPLGGLVRELDHIEAAIERAALDETAPGGGNLPAALSGPAFDSAFAGVIDEAREARDRVRRAAWHELFRDRYEPRLAPSILSRIPGEIDELTEEVVLAACERLGMDVEEQRGVRTWSVEFRSRALVDSLPGVPGGTSFLGTFDREEAVANESIDYYASGHPLVEGILAEIDESMRGRVALLQIQLPGAPVTRATPKRDAAARVMRARPAPREGQGLLAIYRDGPRFEAVAIDEDGRRRPDWAEAATRRPLRSRHVKTDSWTQLPDWEAMTRRLAAALPRSESPVAVAWLVVRERRV